MGGRFSKRPFKFSMWRCRGGDIGKRKVRGGIGRKGSGGGSVPKGAPFCCGEGGTAVCPSRGGDGFLFTCWGWYWKRKAPSWGVAVLSPQDSENTNRFPFSLAGSIPEAGSWLFLRNFKKASTISSDTAKRKRDLRRLFRKSLRFLVGGTRLELVASAL